jgi:hypothetical protein
VSPLAYRCEVCSAKAGEPCRNTINPAAPLPGRSEHLARVLPPGRTKPAKDERNEAIC